MDIYTKNGQQVVPSIADSPTFRICSFNVGNFSGGTSGSPAGSDELYDSFMEAFMQCNANVYMFSEWDAYWAGTTPSNSVLGFLKPYKTTYTKPSSGWMGQMNYSDYAIKTEYHQDFSDSSGYYFVDNVVNINGKNVHLICTHLTWQSSTERKAEIQEILNYIANNNIEYYIIGGDMNLGSDGSSTSTSQTVARESVNLLESNGAKSVQGNGWGCRESDGFFNTYGTYGWKAPAESLHMADNIVVSSNIRIKNIFVIVTDASDHNALCVDLELT